MLPYSGTFASLEAARLEVPYYFNTSCSLGRRHSTLGYCSPHQLEADLS